ncbi:endonuclease NucS (plasmid) [Aneurinibacillus sp. Ricciae_BoGa-3]|uniref:endonuclease NucS domain-containing protein n=1 Tax=Aneurinibacillus sp. Ricciae_BoGa-3 TaxID=3022697 RepID=UPI00234018A9|nr:endonuclease NucS domain-containing protein [Aneurinibacillus sp. Ricciae_BoGa-3]WCK56950.1 endonuclease NucS [Aneurinibacillus sp. Ricciae_BoGa-3]
MNYESELSELFFKKLQRVYGIEQEKVLFHYFYLRFLIEHLDRKLNKGNWNRYLVDFLLQELHIPYSEEGIEYKGETVSKRHGVDGSIENILEDWQFQASRKPVSSSKGTMLSFEMFIQKERNKLMTHAKNKSEPYKSSSFYFSYVKWNALQLLNKRYEANVIAPDKIEGVTYPTSYHFFVRTLEERYYADIHAEKFVTSNTETITESELEKYLIKHLDVIEEGLTYVGRQYTIQNGRIDILARDKEKQYVIIELKVTEDKELLWQSIYYPIQFKTEHQVDNVRMITVAPMYPLHILLPLQKIGGVEMIEFSPRIELGKIKSLSVKKIS